MKGRRIFWVSAGFGCLDLALAILAAWDDAWHTPSSFRAGDRDTLKGCHDVGADGTFCSLYRGFTAAQYLATTACALAMLTVFCALFRPRYAEGLWRFTTTKTFGRMAGVLMIAHAAVQWTAFMLVAAIKSNDDRKNTLEYKLGRTFVIAVVGCFFSIVEASLLIRFSNQAGEGFLYQCCFKLYDVARISNDTSVLNSGDAGSSIWRTQQPTTSRRVYPKTAPTELPGPWAGSGIKGAPLDAIIRRPTAARGNPFYETGSSRNGVVAAAYCRSCPSNGMDGAAQIAGTTQPSTTVNISTEKPKHDETAERATPANGNHRNLEEGTVRALCSPATESVPSLTGDGVWQKPIPAEILPQEKRSELTPPPEDPAQLSQGSATKSTENNRTACCDIGAKPRDTVAEILDGSDVDIEAETQNRCLPRYHECLDDTVRTVHGADLSVFVAAGKLADANRDTSCFGSHLRIAVELPQPSGHNANSESRSPKMEAQAMYTARNRDTGAEIHDGNLSSLVSGSRDIRDDVQGMDSPSSHATDLETSSQDTDVEFPTLGSSISFIELETRDVDLSSVGEFLENYGSPNKTKLTELPTFAEYLEDVRV